ncbi:hypothetical protein RHMOL_Rhmol10G0059300 [Rhododendron molle]|uniref:Uncharacterized protein n=1 Tax=Rhododendron molle TaxID=49168 RepID=A0ACC0M0H8_RHOML|nr:hypothetical protein RHMOL_Rhmol10G0059300 [Rhododendron molle]
MKRGRHLTWICEGKIFPKQLDYPTTGVAPSLPNPPSGGLKIQLKPNPGANPDRGFCNQTQEMRRGEMKSGRLANPAANPASKQAHLNWNPKLIAAFSCACKWFDDVAKRALWKEFCRVRAPKMMLDLQSGGSHSVDGNWRALGKLLIYCSGSSKGGLFNNVHIPGHFVYRTRFSRTSGKSFLLPQCRSDVLYVSDPCEHLDQGEEGDVGFFRGIFKSFAMSKVRKMLISRGAQLHPSEVCPYCKAKLWSMLQAKMVPQSASCRLGSYEDCVEYYVCLNGHVLGICTLLPLSDSEASELEDT